MANKFVANPEVLRAKGGAILEQANQFVLNVNTVYSTLEEMLTSDYVDPAIKVIGSQIQSHKEDLAKMAKVIADYADYCTNAGNTVINNQNSIVSNIRV